MLHKEGAEERELLGGIVPFQKNLAAEEVQALLSIYGYSPGKADGVIGLQTRNAIEEFQRDNGLEETRFVDKATWQKLMVFKENNFIAQNKLNVQLVQTALKEAGFDPGAIDGKTGTKTKKAIMAFQNANGLKADGKIGYKTIAKLSEVLPARREDGP
jgi:peptidoglycan hydrolase-like protein with peptidoglycan-binding domain